MTVDARPGGRVDDLGEGLLDAAEEILAETGREDAISMRAVAERVGCTAAAIYRHFDDRTDLVFEVCRRLFTALEAFIEKAAASADDPLEDLRARGRAYIEFGLDHPEAYRILFMGHASAVPEGWDVDELLALGGFEGVVDSVRGCMESGHLGEDDPFEVALVLWAGVHGITSLLISKPWFPWPDPDALIDRLLDAQIDGLRP